jgi:hypothetical protein
MDALAQLGSNSVPYQRSWDTMERIKKRFSTGF